MKLSAGPQDAMPNHTANTAQQQAHILQLDHELTRNFSLSPCGSGRPYTLKLYDIIFKPRP